MWKTRHYAWMMMLAVLACLGAICLSHQLAGFLQPALVGPAVPQTSPTLPSPTMAEEVSAVLPPTTVPVPTATVAEATVPPSLPVRLTVVYDNNPADPRLTAAWGFACLIESRGGRILFDTGGDGAILMQNMATLGINPAAIDAVVLSHNHADHVGGVQALLGSNDHLVVYIPGSFPDEFGRQVGEQARVAEVGGPMEIIEGVHTTGEMGTTVVEQSLIVETARGLVVVTGCAHPGIVDVVSRAAAQGEIDLVIGGFHLRDRSQGDVQAVVEELLDLGVRRVAPCHCTGAEATAEFEAAFGSGFVPCGVGTVITIEP